MKSNILILGFLSSLLLFIACDDDMNSVGLGILPDSDKIHIKADTIFLGEAYTTSIKAKPVLLNFDVTGFAVDSYTGEKSIAFLLGSYFDPHYGSFKADFISGFSSTGRFKPESTITSIDTVLLSLNYYSWVGDSLENMVAKVYPAKKLSIEDRYAYSDIKLQQYIEPNQWANKSYTARDMTIPDSVYNGGASYIHNLSFDITNSKMPQSGKTIAKAFLDEWRSKPATFDQISTFQEFFPGIYVTTEGGNGSLLKIHDANIFFKYKYTLESGKDSTATTYISATKNVIQSSQYLSETTLPLNQLNLDTSYIWSPAGVFTQYTIPISKIKSAIGNRVINTVKLKVSAYPKEYKRHSLNTPSTLLLVKADSLDSYFNSSGNISNLVTYKATYSNGVYNFGDISAFVRDEISNDSEEVKVVLVPVVEKQDQTNSYYPITETAYDIVPAAVKLRTGKDFLRLEILSTELAAKK